MAVRVTQMAAGLAVQVSEMNLARAYLDEEEHVQRFQAQGFDLDTPHG